MAVCECCWAPGQDNEETPDGLEDGTSGPTVKWQQQGVVLEDADVGRFDVDLSADGTRGVAVGRTTIYALNISENISVAQELSVIDPDSDPFGTSTLYYSIPAVSISGNSKVLAIGCPWSNTTGRTFIYVKNSGSWVLSDTIVAPSGSTEFGRSLDLDYSGKNLVISSGPKAYIFRNDSSSGWTLSHTITRSPNTSYRQQVAISTEGTAVACMNGTFQAIIAETSNGTTWSTSQTITAIHDLSTTANYGTTAVHSGTGCFSFTQRYNHILSANQTAVWKKSGSAWTRSATYGGYYFGTYQGSPSSVDGQTGWWGNLSNWGAGVALSKTGEKLIVCGAQKTGIYAGDGDLAVIRAGNLPSIDRQQVLADAWSAALSYSGKVALLGLYQDSSGVALWKEVEA